MKQSLAQHVRGFISLTDRPARPWDRSKSLLHQGTTVAHTARRLLILAEIGPNVGATLAASDEQRLKIGQPDIIRPSIGADRCEHPARLRTRASL